MKAAVARKPLIRVAVVESDPLRFVGFRALFDSEADLELISASLPELGQLPNVDLILLGNRNGQNLFDIMASLKAVRPDLRIIVTVKAHVAKLMRKVGVQNRIALSVHAITHSLVTAK